MKLTHLFTDIVSLENLFLAWKEFRVGKRTKPDVCEFEYRLDDNLFELHELLTKKKYIHDPYKEFYINDPKRRHIHKASVRDRILHHAIHRILSPRFDPLFIHSLYSSRVHKGTHRGVIHLRDMMRSVYQTHGSCFVLQCDIKRFFPSINHTILRSLLEKYIHDSDLMWLMDRILDSFHSEESTPLCTRGLPLGNVTSQLLVNIYMNECDQFVKHALKEKYYIRYADDFAVVHHDKHHLENLIPSIKTYLKKSLDLSLHPRKISIRHIEKGVDYLGYVILPHAIVLRTKTKKRITRKIRRKTLAYKKGYCDEEAFDQTLASYWGILSHAHSHTLRNEIEQMIDFILTD